MLVIKRPWPSMIRTIWGDPERFKKSYYPRRTSSGKYYLAGDGAIRDKERLLHDHGPHRRRAQRLRPPAGHDGNRVGAGRQSGWWRKPRWSGGPTTSPAKRSARSSCSSSARPSGDDALKIAKELRDWVGKEIGPIAKPKDIRFGDNLPKTRSGKIMRRLLRSIAKGEEITQDVSTLENPGDPGAAEAGELAIGRQGVLRETLTKIPERALFVLARGDRTDGFDAGGSGILP